MASTSRAVSALIATEAELNLQPKHGDSVGGFSRMGSMIATQGTLAAVPLVFLTVWLVLITLGAEQKVEDDTILDLSRYANWSVGFLFQSIIALLFVLVCFLIPFARLQLAYRKQVKTAQDITRSVDSAALSGAERTEHVSLLEALRGLPSSPVVPSLKFTFTISNATPYFLIAVSMLLPEKLWQLLEGVLGAVLG